ncbi:PLC-like phosphodiesterase [Tilletiopsis washingtonensis]|uniref:Phosphoinositide phospholipase C n=1 Tax=Tilletiopsis washingtonensis TaxID=58919 RepID=A0A316ZCQ8_9BASI|nr:PLC-like phosphodiesterase [Tilletiopsis washingtonensis]PWN98804.1 PLC-like phosphodiesterase [Tilletiopsis washingtonensis]
MSAAAPTDDAPSVLTHRFARFNPFRGSEDEGGDEQGQAADPEHIAGGGHVFAGRGDEQARRQLRVSHALRAMLAQQGEIRESDVGGGDDETLHSSALQDILARPQVAHPEYVTDRSHPLSEYFISSSHNTYLVAHQLYGKSSSDAYKAHLSAGARCVEIDAWPSDNPMEPKVTHGMTLTDHIPFREVCRSISQQMDKEIHEAKEHGLAPPAPIFISLENHAPADGQLRLAAIMREELGDKLVTEAVHGGSEATLEELGGRILVMVEYYGDSSASGAAAAAGVSRKDNDSSDSSDDEEARAHRERKNKAKTNKIVPELAALGVYAQSTKPSSDAWAKEEVLPPGYMPQNALVNVEERAVLKLLKEGAGAGLARHNGTALVRIYPKGFRISSSNLNPVPFWACGSQVCALNMQVFDKAAGLNEAMFAATPGWVLKPPHLRRNPTPAPQGKVKLLVEIAGCTDLPVPDGREKDIKPYVTCSLYHPAIDGNEKRKTSHYRPHHHKSFFGKEQPPATSPVWEPAERLEWTYDARDGDFAFLRLLIKSDDAFAKNPAFLTTSVRLVSVPNGQWIFFRLLNLKGGVTPATLLARFTLSPA